MARPARTSKTVKATEVKTAEVKAPEVKAEAPKTEAPKAEVKAEAPKAEVKAEAPKAAEKAPKAAKAPAAKKETVKKAEPKTNVYVEFGGKQVAAKDVLAAAKKAFTKAHKDVAIKTIDIYVNAEQGAAYYVVNGEGSDDYKIEL